MDLEGLANLSWREALIAVIALLALYVALVFLRIRRLKRKSDAASIQDPRIARSAVAAYAAEQEPVVPTGEANTPAPVPPVLPEPPPVLSELPFPWNEPPATIPGQRMIENLEQEVARLRREIGGLRAEIQVLREEQRREIAKSQVSQNVSPLYSDAMQMALQGHDAATISQRCGIARAEADLVVALARNQDSGPGDY